MRDKLEVAALNPDYPATIDGVWETEVSRSIAISLKRIADALTGEGPSILTAPINSYGEGIGDAIQGQMIRGQRGVDQYEERP